VVISRKHLYTPAKKSLCKQETIQEFVALPLGDAYTVSIDNGTLWFGSNAFSMACTDQGLLKKISLNSDPRLDDTISATASLVKEVAAIAAIAAAPTTAALVDVPKPEEAEKCGAVVEAQIVCVKSLEEWKPAPGCTEPEEP
jgi:hypothetical protein